jgi:hypothetical protein
MPTLQEIDALIERYGEADGAVTQACLAYVRAQNRIGGTYKADTGTTAVLPKAPSPRAEQR